MIDDRMALADLPEKGSNVNVPCAMVAFTAERLMAADTGSRVGTDHGQRSEAHES